MWYVPGWAVGVAVIIIAGSLARALPRMFRGADDRPTLRSGGADVAELRDALDGVTKRLGELEERLDFAERLLAQKAGAERLVSPEK